MLTPLRRSRSIAFLSHNCHQNTNFHNSLRQGPLWQECHKLTDSHLVYAMGFPPHFYQWPAATYTESHMWNMEHGTWVCAHELEACGGLHLNSAVNPTCTPAHWCLLHSACHLCACLRFTAALWRTGSLLILSKSGQNQQLEDTVIQTPWKPADLSGIGLRRTALPGGALFSRVSRD